MSKKGTAEDFANARFAEHPNGRNAHRINHPDGWSWAIEDLNGNRDRVNENYMMRLGWVPVPTKPTITMSEYKKAVMDGDSFTERLEMLGIAITPDPEPTNAELLVEDLAGIYGANLNWTAKVAISEALAERGWVKAPDV